MKRLLLSVGLLAAALPALAQSDASEAADRARIGEQRAQAEARFAAQEVACYKTFAVNDCLKAARTERRERLSGLQRRELVLNEAERKRRAAERLRGIEEGESAARDEEAAARRVRALARQAEKDAQAAARAARTAPAPREVKAPKTAPAPTPGASRAAKAPASHDTAKALQQSAQRQQDARERQERVAKRQAQAAAKAPVQPLPVPP